MPEHDLDLVDFDWLVEERGRIQAVSLRLLRLMKSKREQMFANIDYADAALLMVGAAFSLWRAVFLAHTSQTTDKNFDDAQKLIQKVIRHNSIFYADDVSAQAWSFGFYLNNCRFRLQHMQEAVDLGLGGLEWLKATLPINADPKAEWTRHCNALEQALAALEARLSP